MVQSFIRAVSGISRLFGVVATVLLVAAMLVVCHMIVVRYIFREATVWQTDFVVFSATAAIFLGSPYVLLKGGHVGVDVVEMMVGPRTRSVMRGSGQVLGFIFCAAMLVASSIQYYEAWIYDWRLPTVWGPPLWIPLAALPIGFALLCLQYIAEMLRLLTGGEPASAEPAHDMQSAGETTAANVVKETSR